MLRLGYHVSITDGFDLAFDRASQIGCTAMQIFPSNPRGWSVKELASDEVKKFRDKSKSFDIKPVLVHMPYLPNLASSKQQTYSKSIELFSTIIRRCDTLEIPYLITHLGSHLGEGRNVGIEKVSSAINQMAELQGKVVILLENEAGQKNSVGSSLDELAEIYDRIDMKNKGFCMDTCHLFAAGYDIRKPQVLDQIESEIGFEKVFAIHLNDAMFELGSCKDRHENIGFGQIGKDGFRVFLGYKSLLDKPMILETPRKEDGISEKEELSLVRSLAL